MTIKSNTVTANDLTIFYEESGSGDPLILLHGSVGSGAHWRPYASRLAPHHRVIIPDARDQFLPVEQAVTLYRRLPNASWRSSLTPTTS